MTKSIQQIKQNLLEFEKIVAALAIELQDLYSKYLNSLSKSVQKQLILVSYQICTQEYPQSFLNLSLERRHNLQQNLRQLGHKIRDLLISILKEDNSPTETFDRSEDIEPLSNNHPEYWIDWHQNNQRTISEAFENISKDANQLLKEAKIIPDRLPEKVMEMAIAAENTDSPISGYPNMLNMLIEAENESEEEDDDSTITRLTAIRLRLSEIEFSDPSLSALGNQIRNLLVKIDKIRQQYRKKERELLTAEAEASWRSSWYED